MATLRHSIHHYLDHALAPSTQATYRAAWASYLNFCRAHFISPLPPSEIKLAAYAAYLADRHITHNTIRVYLPGIAYHSLRLGHKIDLHALPDLHYVLRGIRRVQGTSLSRPLRDPVTSQHMLAIRAYLANVFSAHDACMLWAALTSAFFGLLRASEYTSPSSSTSSPGTLLRSHVSFATDLSRATLLLPISKTDQFGRGVNIALFALPSPLCPVSALWHFCRARRSPARPLFIFQNGHFLTRDWVVAVLRRTFPDEPNLNTHSFRIGGASALAAAGTPDYVIQILGRWSSDSFLRYIRTPQFILRNAQLAMAPPHP